MGYSGRVAGNKTLKTPAWSYISHVIRLSVGDSDVLLPALLAVVGQREERRGEEGGEEKCAMSWLAGCSLDRLG